MAKKYLVGIISAAVILIGAVAVKAQSQTSLYEQIIELLLQLNKERITEISLGQEVVLGGQGQRAKVCQGDGVATTSPTFLTDGAASSTCEFFVENMPSVDLNYTVSGSSTAATIQAEVYFSPDDNDGATSDGTWYPALTKIVEDGMVTYSTGPAIFKLPTNGYSTSTRSVLIDDIQARWMQVQTAVSGANGSFHLEIAGRRNY